MSSRALRQGYDLVLGADVCYSVKALPALFTAAAGLLARRPGAEFWLGYVSRCARACCAVTSRFAEVTAQQ
jgi:hypothetical protein